MASITTSSTHSNSRNKYNVCIVCFGRKGRREGFIDEEASPSSFYIQHPYGMALLYGETNKEDFYVQGSLRIN